MFSNDLCLMKHDQFIKMGHAGIDRTDEIHSPRSETREKMLRSTMIFFFMLSRCYPGMRVKADCPHILIDGTKIAV